MKTLHTLAFSTLLVLLVGCSSSHHQHADRGMMVTPDGGRVWNIFGLEIIGKVMSAETAGQYSVVQSATPPGGGPPLHLHQHEDEMFYIVEGTYEFRCGDDRMIAEKGAIVLLPRGLPHSFRNIGDTPGLTINTMTPGGFEGFFEEIDQLPKKQPPDRAKINEIAARYGLTFIRE